MTTKYVVKNQELECYGWKQGEEIKILDDLTEKMGLPEKFYNALNVTRNEMGGVLESQIQKITQ